MNFVRNFLKKIVSRFKESWDGSSSEINQEVKRLRPLSMNFFYPNLCDHNTEQHFRKGGYSDRDEYVLLREYGINLKEMEVSRLINCKIIQRKHNVLDRQICDHLDCKFVSKSCCLEFTNEKLFKIVIGKLKERPILYMN